MENATRLTLRLPPAMHQFLATEARRLSHQRGYRKSINRLIIDLVWQAMRSEPEDRPWMWSSKEKMP